MKQTNLFESETVRKPNFYQYQLGELCQISNGGTYSPDLKKHLNCLYKHFRVMEKLADGVIGYIVIIEFDWKWEIVDGEGTTIHTEKADAYWHDDNGMRVFVLNKDIRLCNSEYNAWKFQKHSKEKAFVPFELPTQYWGCLNEPLKRPINLGNGIAKMSYPCGVNGCSNFVTVETQKALLPPLNKPIMPETWEEKRPSWKGFGCQKCAACFYHVFEEPPK
jgi:hypothetical protein